MSNEKLNNAVFKVMDIYDLLLKLQNGCFKKPIFGIYWGSPLRDANYSQLSIVVTELIEELSKIHSSLCVDISLLMELSEDESKFRDLLSEYIIEMTRSMETLRKICYIRINNPSLKSNDIMPHIEEYKHKERSYEKIGDALNVMYRKL